MSFGVYIQASLCGIDGIYAGYYTEYGGDNFDHGGLDKDVLVAGDFGIDVGSIEVRG